MCSDKRFKGITITMIILLYASYPAYGEGNLHLGALEVRPFTCIEQKYDDNIFLEPDNQENDDWITTSTLGLGLQMPIVPEREEDFLLKVKYAADIIEFWEERDQSRVDHTLSALADLSFANDIILKIDENFKKTADPANSELTGLEKRTRNTVRGVLGYMREKIGFDLGYENTRDDYNILNNLDKYEHVVTTTGYYQIYPKTSVFSEYNFGKIAYDDSSTNSDSKYHQVRLGIKGEITPKLTGVIKAGYKQISYNDSSKNDFSGFTIFGNLTHNLRERTTINIYGERSSPESTYGTNSFFKSNKIGLKLDYQLLERLFLVTGGFYQLNKYPDETTEDSVTGKRRDHIGDGSIGLRYEVKDWAFIEIDYEYKQRDSRFAAFDYTDKKVMAKASLEF